MEDLENEIHRYQYENIHILVKDIYKDIIRNKEEKSIYTISLVNNEQLHKLPNVNIVNLNELEEFYKRYFSNKQFQEIWYCKKQTKMKQAFSIGRISINTSQQMNDIMQGQIIEQVWNTNHRSIEKYTQNNKIAYLRASRICWGTRYSIDKIQEPQSTEINKQQMIAEFIENVKEIEKSKENIEEMAKYLNKLNINQFSLEYLKEGNKFMFIDWDSQNDLKVINKLIKTEDNQREEKIER